MIIETLTRTTAHGGAPRHPRDLAPPHLIHYFEPTRILASRRARILFPRGDLPLRHSHGCDLHIETMNLTLFGEVA